MAFTEGGNEGALNGTTAVDVVTAPSSGRRLVRNVGIYNADTADVTVTLRKNKAGTLSLLAKETLSPGDTFIFDKLTVLDASDEKVQAVMSGAAAATNPDFDAAFADVT